MWPFSNAYPEVRVSDIQDEYDYIIVGGGTAGCVLANRLSAMSNTTVLLVERGPLADSWASRVPLFSSDFASNGSRTQLRTTEHQPETGHSYELLNGSALGGSTRVNQMIYTRGLKAEYDMWKASGCSGWGWNDVKASFLKSERCLDAGADSDVHGTLGEWCNQATAGLDFPGFQKTIDACEDIGLPKVDDVNSPTHPAIGCGLLHFTRDQNQHRHSTYRAFLPKDLALSRRQNLHIVTNAIVERVQIEKHSDKLVARGIDLVSRSGKGMKSVGARNEIILCAGPFGSPHILMLSGIGPADHLKEHGIEVVKDLPAVGSNLEDHFGVSIAYRVPMAHSLVALEKRPWIFFIELFRYLFYGTGMLLAPVLQLAIFASTLLLDHQGLPQKGNADVLPDIEIMPMAYDSGNSTNFDKSTGVYSFLNVLLRPKSKGTVRLSSGDPNAPLRIDPRYLSNPADWAPLRASLRLTLRIADGMRKHGYALDNMQVPQGEDDEALDNFIRRRNRTAYHYSSTCRMAPKEDASGGGGVVDPQLKVFGVEGLRVADSSVFPWVLGAHLQAPTVCVAERCAEMVVEERSMKE